MTMWRIPKGYVTISITSTIGEMKSIDIILTKEMVSGNFSRNDIILNRIMEAIKEVLK